MKITIKNLVQPGIAAVLSLLVVAAVACALSAAPAVRADAVAVLQAQGVTCGACAGKIERALKVKSGVAAVEVDVESGKVTAAYDSKAVKPEALAETVTAAGYESTVVKTMTVDQYRELSGKGAAAQDNKSGGCGGDCCDKKKKTK